jgi:hypothetical protein
MAVDSVTTLIEEVVGVRSTVLASMPLAPSSALDSNPSLEREFLPSNLSAKAIPYAYPVQELGLNL